MKTCPVPRSLLGGLTIEAFLRDYWHKQPLLIRGAWPGVDPGLSAEELAGLACEDPVESRLVLERDGTTPWEVRHGPFCESDFTSLPASHWTLLVQAVDRHVPAAADLLDQFRFIPAWRLDDLMISYAPAGGSVGPHIDNYDVFLLQGQGQRQWAINRHTYGMDDFIPGLDLRILREFEAEEAWTLAPGDMLYLPPGVAHHGVAVDDCLTLSIGFRAPSRAEWLPAFADDDSLHNPDRRYRDPDLRPQRYSGELTTAARSDLRALLRETINDDRILDHWLGCELSRVGEPQPLPRDPPWTFDRFIRAWIESGYLQRSLDCRLLFMQDGDSIVMFANGNAWPLPAVALEAVVLLSGHRNLALDALSQLPAAKPVFELLLELFNLGLFDFDTDQDDQPQTAAATDST